MKSKQLIFSAVLCIGFFFSCSPKLSDFDRNLKIQTVSLKSDVINLMGKAIDSYSLHETEIKLIQIKIDKQIELIRQNKPNSIRFKMYIILNDPQGHLFGGFLSIWKREDKLSLAYVDEQIKMVGKAFDQIVELESAKINPSDIVVADHLPIIPNPPPQPTNYIILNEKKINQFKKYGDLDALITKVFQNNHIDKRIYLAFEGGGFAISSPMEEITTFGSTRPIKVNKKSNSFLEDFFSKAHIKELFHTQTGYFRCIIFIFSPNIYSLSNSEINGNEIKSWLDAKYFRLPVAIANQPLPEKTQGVVLLYEFEQNENLPNKFKIIDSANVKTNLRQHVVIKALINYIDN